MTPAEHAKAIEDAARKVTQASIDYMVDSGLAYKLGRAEAALQSAIRAGVGAAPPKDSAEFALAALVAAGHVSQEKVDEARALMPAGGYKAKTVPQRGQFLKCYSAKIATFVSVCPECGDKRCARAKNHANGCSAAAPKP